MYAKIALPRARFVDLTLVRTALLVTLEMVKFFQAIIINLDESMVFRCLNDKGEEVVTSTSVQTSNLNEELG